MEGESSLALHAEYLAGTHEAHVAIRFPDFESFSVVTLAEIAFGDLRDGVVDFAV